jgi:lysophospholipase L1-like esterase
MQMNNQYLAELSKARANFHVIDWYPLARSHPDWLYSDGTHPNLTGAEQYAKLIHDTLVKKISAQ